MAETSSGAVAGARLQLSIALCTYNGERHLEEQLRSYAAQERLPDELVVCDDHSTDGSVAVVETFAASAPFAVRLIRNEENLGYRRNFANALQMCKGDLIALSDQDDVWYPHKLRVLEAQMLEHPGAQAIFSDGDLIDGMSKPVGRTLWRSFRFGRGAQQRYAAGGAVEELLRRNMVTGMTLAVRSRVRHLLQDAPASWIHDGWLAFLLGMQAELLACPERLVGYRVHGEQQVGTPPTAAAKVNALRAGGVRAYAGRLRQLNLEEYQRTEREYGDLLLYLEQQGLGKGPVQAAVRAKQQHAARGAAALVGNRWNRLAVLARARSYARFAPNGWRGMVRDMVI